MSEETLESLPWGLYVTGDPSLHRGGWLLTHGPWPLFCSISFRPSCSPAAAPSHEAERVFQASVALATSDDRFLFFFPYKVDACVALKGSD